MIVEALIGFQHLFLAKMRITPISVLRLFFGPFLVSFFIFYIEFHDARVIQLTKTQITDKM